VIARSTLSRAFLGPLDEVAVDGADGPGAHSPAAAQREQRGGLHLDSEQAGVLPVGDVLVGLVVERVVADDGTDVDVLAPVFGGVDERP
jgi:hypothetical protein